MNITFDKYHTYDEIRAFLQECVLQYPELCRIECIGKSYQGREILMVEITNRKTGPGSDKPGIYTDANTHAGEVTGAEVVVYTIKMLLEGYGKDPRITHLVDTRVFYFIPRIAVDGSEYYLSTPYMLRSSLRPWPEETDDKPGLYPEDVDGDGKILQMRVKNPDGAWRVSKKDPRIMVRRRPDDLGAPGEVYYDVYTEGLVRDYDPDVPVGYAPGKHRLDFNRQYPTNWALPVRQPGSGDYPFSEPEMKAIGDFVLSRPNIVSTMAYHTSGGVLLRPLCDKPDRNMDGRDLAIYRALGEIGEELTGYPLKSVFESFTWDPEKPEVGSDLEWFYETLGILAFETELWDMQGRAGIRKRSLTEMRNLSEKDREEDALKLLKWNDEEMGGALFHDWRPFNHPQLGEVEIGGWEPKMGRQNPPVCLLEDECKRNAQFTLTRAAVTPHLVIEKFVAEPLGDGLYKVEAVVKNDGYLPTHVTYQALKVRQAKPVKLTLCGGEVAGGKEVQEIGHLGGRSGGGDTKKKITWVVRAEKGTKLTVLAHTPRAGKAQAELTTG
ncbi:MAG TPA: carboxypeptidase [Firmicutes bacterium]|nr:carboxypeptidase [Candidatus Fermentithermobacillaceae bacterium]